MRGWKTALTVGFITTALGAVMVFPSHDLFVWNRTESAPKGLYRLSDGPLTLHGWAVVSADAPSALWISSRGYLATDWPIIKRVRGLPGDEICRETLTISINGKAVARALESDSRGQELPVWQGCFTINADEVFLLNDHERSLDGRYFGVTARKDIRGSAVLVWRTN
ncbi:MAG: S26 family signal peptidase [Pseudomonadota bacterium]